MSVTLDSLRAEGIDAVLFDQVRVEPTDVSFKEAIEFAADGGFDGYVAVGGGSSIDTAKAADLYATYPADFLAYVNAPIGEGLPVPGPLEPLIAVPTTSGTGSETTGVAIFDLIEMGAKTGIAHRALRPVMGLVDPDNTRTLPAMVKACSGLDVLCHGLESFTALPFSERQAAENPGRRPTYQGSNPISDVWAVRAIEMVSQSIVRAVDDPDDGEARAQMLLAATFAGIGFGNAGVHLPHGMSYPVSGLVRDYVPEGYPSDHAIVPHGMSYPVSGLVRDYVPEGYPSDHAIVPHGMSVALTAPAVFRFTSPASPERHMRAARLMGADVVGASPGDSGDLLAEAVVRLLRRIGMPNGLGEVGYGEEDAGRLAAGTLPQHRVTKLSPRPASEDDLRRLFLDSMALW